MSSERPIDRFDPGWLFLIAGMTLLCATVLIPAQRDIETARWQRDRALAIEDQRRERLFRHERYLAALDAQEPAVVRSLAASQLNLIPEGRAALLPASRASQTDASVFPSLEPRPIALPAFARAESLLGRWATADQPRLWLIAAGGLLTLIGLLPWTEERANEEEPGSSYPAA